MEAIKLIAKLEKLIEEYGDCDVHYHDWQSMTGTDEVGVVEAREYGFGNKTKIFYLE